MAISEAGRDELYAGITAKDMGVTADKTLGGLALIVLGILALTGIYPALLNSIDAIVAGVTVVFMSLTLMREFNEALSFSGPELASSEAAGGMGAGTLAGIAGIILGILAILDIARPYLMAVALIVFGAAVFIDFVMSSQVRALRMTTSGTAGSSRAALPAAASMELASLLIGVALVTLGIIALTGVRSELLIAVAFLSFGGYLFLKGTAGVGQIFTLGRSATRSTRPVIYRNEQ
jgi:hypothetical protein